MFEKRLRVLLGLFGLAVALILARLVDLQVVHGSHYARQAQRSRMLKPIVLPFVRGRIVDRLGRPLVQDEPCWALSVDYQILLADVSRQEVEVNRALERLKRRYRRQWRFPPAISNAELLETLRGEMTRMWSLVAERFSTPARPLTVAGLRERARVIYERVSRVRRVVAARRGFEADVLEERNPHPVVIDLDADERVVVKEQFGQFPWLSVVPSSARVFQGRAEPFAHVLGRLARVDASTVENDPEAHDAFVRYLPEERTGVSGVEYLAERDLRGRRGQVIRGRDNRIVELIEAENGNDATVTLHAGLQERLYDLLGDVVAGVPESSGGTVVVLDIESREVLALVSYPSYDPNHFGALYPALRADTERLPLRFRAVANSYAPGSTIKPLICLTGLTSEVISIDSQYECSGYLFPEQRKSWRCWAIHGTSARMAHGSVNVVAALTGSCNVFMYRLGENLGIDRLCGAFDMVGVGRTTGIGLREEAFGLNPTPGTLMERFNRPVYRGHPRLFAIGQGELLMTPLQVANLMATYASGRFRHVTLVRTTTPTLEWTLPGTQEQWLAIRRGIHGVVNDPNGTAHRYAFLDDPRYALCGKTGSATVSPWPTAYRISFKDADGRSDAVVIPAGARRPAIEAFVAKYPDATFDPAQVVVARRWPPFAPPEGENFSHAWFGAFLQARRADGSPDWSVEPRIAFSVLVEFGGSGGRTSGPLARRITQTLIEELGADLDAGTADGKTALDRS